MSDMNIDTEQIDWQQIALQQFARIYEQESLIRSLKASHAELQATLKAVARTPLHPSSRVTH